jgi:hypothetical protein
MEFLGTRLTSAQRFRKVRMIQLGHFDRSSKQESNGWPDCIRRATFHTKELRPLLSPWCACKMTAGPNIWYWVTSR